MMKLFKEQLAWTAPLAVILIIALFSVNLFAQGNPQPKNLPVALIVNDSGQHVENVLTVIEKATTVTENSSPALKFTTELESDIEQLFVDKKYYAALVIPEGYDASLQTLLTTQTPASLSLYVNEGYNMTGSNVAKTAITALVNGLSKQYSTQFTAQLKGQKIDIEQAFALVNPIQIEQKVFNPVTASTANGSAPTLLAVAAWVGALIGGFIVFLAVSNIKRKQSLNRTATLKLMGGQILFGVIIALFSGFTVATLATLAKINMPGYLTVALFVSFAAFCFYLLVSAITAWIGKPAITIFMVIMLLGMGVLIMPKEMLPDFFVNFIRPWVPLRFASEGLRELFYFGSGFYTGASFNTILGIGIGGFLIFLLSIFKTKKVT